MASRISALVSPEFLAVLVAMQGADKEMQAQIRKHTKGMAQPEWQAAVAKNVKTRQEQRVLADTARATVSNQNVTLKSASVGRALSGGAKPIDIAKSVEFGSSKRQFRARRKGGYVVYQAAAKLIPRIAALYVQTAARTLHEAAEGKR